MRNSIPATYLGECFDDSSTPTDSPTVSAEFKLDSGKLTLMINNPWYSHLWLLKERYKSVANLPVGLRALAGFSIDLLGGLITVSAWEAAEWLAMTNLRLGLIEHVQAVFDPGSEAPRVDIP